MKRWILIILTLALCSVFIVENFIIVSRPGFPPPKIPDGSAPTFVHDNITRIIASGDGASIVNTANGTLHNAYRARRGLPILLVYLVALGHPQWMPYSMIPIFLIGACLLVLAVGDWLGDRWMWAPLVLLLPGALTTLNWLGPNLLGLGLALYGWRKKDWRFLAAAGLVHETFLLFALHRRMARPFLVYGAWALGTGIAIGWGGAEGNTFGPFLGFSAHPAGAGLVLALTTIAIGLYLLSVPNLRWVSALYLVLMLCLGQEAWYRWQEAMRILLPLWVLGFVGLHHYWAARQMSRTTHSADGRDIQLDPMPTLSAHVAH